MNDCRAAPPHGPEFPAFGRKAAHAAVLTLVPTIIVTILAGPPGNLADFNCLPWRWIPALLGLVTCSWLCNGARLSVLCRALGYPVPFKNTFAASLAAEFAVAATPAGTGGALTYVTLLGKAGVPGSMTASLLAAEVAIDLSCFALFTAGGGVLLASDPTWFPASNRVWEGVGTPAPAVWVVVAGVTGLAIAGSVPGRPWTKMFRFGRAPARVGFTHRLLRMADRLALGWCSTRAATAFLVRHRRSALTANFALAIVQWSCRYAVLPVLVSVVGAQRNPLPLVLLQALLTVVSLAVVAPGGGGSVEFLAAMGLQGYVAPAQAGGVLLMWRATTFHLYVLAGGIVLLSLLRRGTALRRTQPPSAADGAPAEFRPDRPWIPTSPGGEDPTEPWDAQLRWDPREPGRGTGCS